MTTSHGIWALLGAGTISVLTGAAHAELLYTFDTDAQGWGAINDTSFLGWDGSIGNPAGALRGVDQVSGAIWYFSAPAADLGNLSSLYGETISYDILGINGDHSDLDDLADVIITGAGMSIGININTMPVNGDWTSWSATVDASAGWEGVTSLGDGTLDGTAVSEATIQSVLSDVTGVFIRGEYTSGSDSAALDNVRLVPAPGSAALLGLAGLASMRRRR